MATLGNSFHRRNQLRQDESASIEQQLAKLEDDIRRLKIDFGIYFTGGLKRPPHEARGRIEAALKRIADDRHITFAQRFHYNTIVNQYTSYRELWRRKLKEKGEEIV